jgi:hypothetical protein
LGQDTRKGAGISEVLLPRGCPQNLRQISSLIPKQTPEAEVPGAHPIADWF